MHKITFFLLVLVLSFSAFELSASNAGQIAVTVDDLPCVGPRTRSARENIEKIVGHLTAENVSATGFVCGDRGNFVAVEPWIKAGLPLGNHTFSHPALTKISVNKFIADIEKNEKAYKDKLNVTLRGSFFRFPFLDHGNSPEKVDQLEEYFKKAPYRLAHVTFDTIDYQFAVEYAKTNNKELVSGMYIEHLQQCADHFASMSQLLFERQIPLILLIHANELNADLLGRALKSLKQKGWQFISLEDAVKDQVYQPYLYRVPMPKCPGDRNFMNQIALSRGIKVNDISGDAYFKAHWLPMLHK